MTTVTLGRTAGEAAIDAGALRATTVNLGVKPYLVSQIWEIQVSLRGNATLHAVKAGDTYRLATELGHDVLVDNSFTGTFVSVSADSRANIGRVLAASINASAADVFTATSDDTVLVIVNRDGGVFRTSLTVGGSDVGVAGIDRSTPTEAAIDLSGNPASGEVWEIMLSDGVSSTPYRYTVKAVDTFKNGLAVKPEDTLAIIAAGLAESINSVGSGDNANFAAVAEGDLVVIVRHDGKRFAATPGIVSAGQPVAGEVRSVTLTSASLTTTVTVTSPLDTIRITPVTGTLVNPAGTVSRPAAGDTGGLVVSAATASATLTRAPLTGETWTIRLNGSNAVSVAYGENVNGVVVTALEQMVVALAFKINALADFNASPVTGDTLAAVARKLAEQVNILGLPEFHATSEGEVLRVENIAGNVFTASFASTVRTVATDAAHAGETWVVTLQSVAAGALPVSFSHRVGAAETNADVVQALASLINLTAGFHATGDGGALSINSTGGSPVAFTTSFLIANSFFTTPSAAPAQAIAAASAVANAGQTWVATIHGAGGAAPISVSYQVGVSETNADVVLALATLIDQIAGYHATASGGTLSVTNLAANPFVMSVAVAGTEYHGVVEAGAAIVATRVEGINYYEFETLNVALGSGNDIINVQGTTATTNLDTGGGDDRIYVSSAAAFAVDASANAVAPDFLTGHLHNINGALNIDAGTGRAQLMISGEASTLDNNDIVITDAFANADGIVNLTRAPRVGETWTVALNSSVSVSVAYGEFVDSVAVTTRKQLADALAFKIDQLAGFDATVASTPGHDSIAIRNVSGLLANPKGTVTLAGAPDDVTSLAVSAVKAEIAILGLAGGDNVFGWVDLAQGTITYRADATTTSLADGTSVWNGSFADGVTIWTGFGADTVVIDGTQDRPAVLNRAGVRSITTLNTGLGDDTVYVDLQATETNGADSTDGLLVLNTQGPWNNFPTISDNDTVLGTGVNPLTGAAFASTLPLVVFGGQGSDTITGGTADDILFGDRGRTVRFERDANGLETARIVEQLGGGAGDRSDGLVRRPDLVESLDPLVGGNDIIDGGGGNNLMVGGAGADGIAGGAGDDIIAGDNAQIDFHDNSIQVKSARTTDTLDQPTWGDTIVTGAGENIVLAGMGADHVNDTAAGYSPGAVPSSGVDIVIGDNGQVSFDSTGRITSFSSVNAGQVSFSPQNGAANPLNGLNLGSNQSAPAFADVDGDGDLDMLVGNSDGTLRYFENIGTGTAPQYVERSGAAGAVKPHRNPFDGFDVGSMSTPFFGAINGDGDLDLAVGAAGGTLKYYENTGTATAPVYLERTGTANPFDGIDVGDRSALAFADLDGDRDPDLVVGAGDGTLKVYVNTGTGSVPVYVVRTGAANPFNGIDVGDGGTPAFADLDGDGDSDLVVGENGGTLKYYENTGTSMAPVYAGRTGAANPFDGFIGGNLSTPGFADLDGDGDPDLVVGENGGTLSYYRNTSTGAGGNDVILVGDGNNIVVGGFGDDTITAGAGTDVLLGDNGAVVYTPNTTLPLLARSTGVVNAAGGDDTITGGEGNNLVIGGVGADRITAGSGVDLLIGDNGQITWTVGGLLSSVGTTDQALGGNDTIQAGDGNNVVAGGFGADVIDTGVGEDLVLGDNGLFTYTTNAGVAVLTGARTSDTNPTTGGDDVIQSGRGGSASFADVNGDGKLDLVTGAADGSILYFENIGTSALPVYVARTGSLNPLDGIDVGSMSAPSLIDLNADGRVDLVVGSSDGTLTYYENIGTAAVPVYVERTGASGPNPSPFDGIDVGGMSAPAFVDLNQDGDLDLVAGSSDGTLKYYENIGTAAVPVYLERIGVAGPNPNPFDGIDVGGMSAPALVDLNGDGDLDLVVGSSDGTLKAYENTGSATSPAYASVPLSGLADDPFDGIDVGNRSVPVLADLNGDGVLDLVAGENDGALNFYLNTGTNAAPDYTERTGAVNPLTGLDVGGGARNVVLAGVGSDQVVDSNPGQDIVVGDDGYVNWDATTGFLTGFGSAQPDVGGNDVIDVGNGTNVVVGGNGGDTITTGSGADIILGDNAAVTYNPGTANLLQAISTDLSNTTGGDDIVNAGDGDNLIIGGVGVDAITTGTGADLVLGDNGQIDWTTGGVLGQVQTSDPTLGAGDVILVGDGNNIVAGGFGSDVIGTGVGEDLILGDNGVFTYTTGAGGVAVLTGAQTTDTTAATGGGDVIVAGGGPTPVFVDVDGDGDLDAVVGAPDGTLGYFENIGTAAAPVSVERTGATGPNPNPFNGIDVGSNSTPALADVDGDGDQDLVVGEANGVLRYYENTGSATMPMYLEQSGAANPFDAIDAGDLSAPAFVDIGGDGDLDLVVGSSDGTLTVFENTGSAIAPVYAPSPLGLGNPFTGIDVGANSVPAFMDVDGDGDLDLLVGEIGGTVQVYENTGPVATVYVANGTLVSPFAGLDVGGEGSRNIVLAGVGDDRVNQPPRAGTSDPAGVINGGQDIVVGDNGYVSWDVGGLLTGFGSSQTDVGGNDLIDVGNGSNIVVGGFGDDAIATGAGADIVLGDDGRVDYVIADGDSTDIDLVESTSTRDFGGTDTIVTGGGDDIVIGGRMDDTIDAGEGDNLVIGDSGRITAADLNAPQMAGQPVTLGLVETITPADGGNDTIVTGSGDDVVLAGFGGDTVTSGAGNDTLIGDNGQIGYTGATMTTVESTDRIAATGGDDVIDAGNGNNLVIGGVGNDTVTTTDGRDVVIGDNGTIVNDTSGSLLQVSSGNPLLGGNDTISTGDGFDVAIGGAGNDIVGSGGGNDVLFGDGGQVTFAAGGTRLVRLAGSGRRSCPGYPDRFAGSARRSHA
ncbi:MAG: VCBS repeat-containing protein [Sulfuritalea sp.]|nr:VCBS repeat-containing protein [Sulfuritalea sp.]